MHLPNPLPSTIFPANLVGHRFFFPEMLLQLHIQHIYIYRTFPFLAAIAERGKKKQVEKVKSSHY